MLLEKGQIAGVWDAMALMWRPRYISISVELSLFFFCNNLVFQCRYHIFSVLVEAARLVCTTENAMIADPKQWACRINTPSSFVMLSAVLV